MKYTFLIALLGAANAVTLHKGGPAWREPLTPGAALTNSCVNANKTIGPNDILTEQPCSTPGNSAWNTHTTSRTGSQTTALAPPYPDHKLH